MSHYQAVDRVVDLLDPSKNVLYDLTTEQAASQPSGNGGAATDEDEVVEDADYEVVDEGK